MRVIATATGTAKSGYIQRKIIKVCEDIQIKHDGSVRDSTGKVYQMSYNGDGFDPKKMIFTKGQPNPIDISRIADRLNLKRELSI